MECTKTAKKQELSMIIKIPFKTPTVNHLYFNWKNRRILTKEAKDMKIEIKELINNQAFPLFSQEEVPLKVEVEIHENWFCKNGSVARKDIANREKFLIDAVFDAIGIDDKYIFEHRLIKVQDSEEYSLIKIGGIKMAEDTEEEEKEEDSEDEDNEDEE